MNIYVTFFRTHNYWVWLYILVSIFLAACSTDVREKSVSILKVAVIPDQSESIIRVKYQPLLDHLKLHAGLDSKLLIPKSYDELLQWFNDKKIDMALFGGATYVMAHIQNDALPLVMRDIDDRFRSIALIHINNPATSLQELKGASLAFGSRLSTSGHFMPRYFFQQKNIDTDTFFSKIQYSGAHDRTAEWVRDGKVDLGLINSGIVNEMFLDGRLSKDKVKVIWESPAYADYVWAVQPDLNIEQKTLIRDSFLHLNQIPEDKKLLQGLGANYYIPVGHQDFENLEQVILKMEHRKHK